MHTQTIRSITWFHTQIIQSITWAHWNIPCPTAATIAIITQSSRYKTTLRSHFTANVMLATLTFHSNKITSSILLCMVSHSVWMWKLDDFEKDEGKVDGCWNTVLLRTLRISWAEKKRNQEVMRVAGVQCTLLNTIRQRQLGFFSHVIRKHILKHLGVTDKVEGRRARGHQRLKFLDSLYTCWEDKVSPMDTDHQGCRGQISLASKWSPISSTMA